MTIHLNTHPDDRKDMVKAISERTGLDAAYMGPPSFAYQIGAVTVNRDGTIDYEQDPSKDGVIPLLIEHGWLDPGEYDPGADEADARTEPILEQPSDATAVAIRLPLEGWTVQEAKNLLRLVCSKQYLIRRMTGNDELYLSSPALGKLPQAGIKSPTRPRRGRDRGKRKSRPRFGSGLAAYMRTLPAEAAHKRRFQDGLNFGAKAQFFIGPADGVVV